MVKKIWHISDTHTFHGTLKVPNEVDIVIHSGDCSNPKNPYLNEQEVRNFIEWYSTLNIPTKIFIAGNHDTSIEKGLVTKKDFQDKGIIYLENETVEIDDLNIFGSPYTPTFGNGWAFNKDRVKLDRIWSNIIPTNVDIIITHGPPKGILDLSYSYMGDLEFCGCKSLLNTILNRNAKLVLFGHIHNNKDVINTGIRIYGNSNTIFSNASCVTDNKFSLGNTSHGNILEI